MELTHDLLGEIAARYLRSKGWHLALSNLWSAIISEKPDCLAFDMDGKSFLVEAKMSRSDFLADKKKYARKNPHTAAGAYRAYITPKGLLRVDEIPYGWQLWEVDASGKRPKLVIVKGLEFYKATWICEWSKREKSGIRKRLVNMDDTEYSHFFEGRHLFEAYSWLLAIVRRMEASGIDVQKFAASNELWGKK